MFKALVDLYYLLSRKHQWLLQAQCLSILYDAQECLWHVYFNYDKFINLIQVREGKRKEDSLFSLP